MLLWKHHEAEPTCRIGMVGDFLPAGRITLSELADWSGMAHAVAGHFQDLDLSIANLECPLDVGGAPARVKMALGDSFAAPGASLEYLRALKTHVVGLANNHIYDYGESGVHAARQAILAKGMVPLGVARTLSEKPETFVWQGTAGVRVGFWAAACVSRELATRKSPGVEAATFDRARQALKEMKSQGAHCCLALLHAGCERTNRPDPEDVEMMDSLVTLGFAVVAACHSHRISGFKALVGAERQTGFCFYGLGSLSSGVMYSELEREGMLAVVGLDRQGSIVSIEARPILLSESGWGIVPMASEGEIILQRFVQTSTEIENGSYKRFFYEDMSKGLFRHQWRDVRTAYRQGGWKGIAKKLGRLRARHVRRFVRGISVSSQ